MIWNTQSLAIATIERSWSSEGGVCVLEGGILYHEDPVRNFILIWF